MRSVRSFLLLFLGLFLVAGLAACGGGGDDTAAVSGEAPAGETPPAETESAPAEDLDPMVARSLAKDPGPASEIGVITTNHGVIKVRFFPNQAPLAVANFKGLAAQGKYDNVTFHRIMKGFMIQGGDPRGTGYGGTSLWGEKFEDEFDPSLSFNRPGLLAMANSGPNSNSSQFFITEVETPHLDNKHTIFGEVVEGMDVVQAIADVEVGARSKPVEPVVMESVRIVEE